MRVFNSCKEATSFCIETQRAAIAHLTSEEKTMGIHIHNCYEIYLSISGGRQFLIDDRLYDISCGDLFLINNFEPHSITQLDEKNHERYIICLYPEYVEKLSSEATRLSNCFLHRNGDGCRLSLLPQEQQRFFNIIDKLLHIHGYGEDLLEDAAFQELLVMLNVLYFTAKNKNVSPLQHSLASDIVCYIRAHIHEEIKLDDLSRAMHMSKSNLCRIFQKATGTTIGKYITAQRITVAKRMLASGANVSEAKAACGAGDYTHFISSFGKLVGMSPKQYAKKHYQAELCQFIPKERS